MQTSWSYVISVQVNIKTISTLSSSINKEIATSDPPFALFIIYVAIILKARKAAVCRPKLCHYSHDMGPSRLKAT